MTETQEAFGSKLLNTVMEAMFSEEMTELEALVERMERLYPPEMERPKSSIPAAWQQWAGQSAIIRTDSPETFQRVRNGYLVAAVDPCLSAQIQAYHNQRYAAVQNSNGLGAALLGLGGGIFGGLF